MEGKHRPKILIVDDVPENLHILMEALKDEFAVVAATGGEKALRLARGEGAPDLILLDVMMPDMGGYEVCERLKGDVRTARIPVIFVTALTDEEDEARGLALGAVDYVTKPFRPNLVKARVRNHLELKRHRDHLEDLVRERTRELLLTREVTIESLAVLAEHRDPETGGHIQRTQHYVRFLAERAAEHPDFAGALSSEVIELLFHTAPLHDIGKVGVPDAILLKPGKLTEEEFQAMRRHTVYGYNTLLAAERKLGRDSFLRYAREIAHSHHERWDGSGYPQGLEKDGIPLEARIMAVADVYDALISKRPYKAPFPHRRAVEIIAAGRGNHFDPRLVELFLAEEETFRKIALAHVDYEEERKNLAAPERPPQEPPPLDANLVTRIEHER